MFSTERSDVLTPLALFAAIVIAVLLGYAALAHADTGAVAVAPPATGLGITEWIAICLAALAGVRVIVDAALAFFKMLAPKTKTTVDDTIRDDLQLAHDKLDALSNTVSSLVAWHVQNKPQEPNLTVVAKAAP